MLPQSTHGCSDPFPPFEVLAFSSTALGEAEDTVSILGQDGSRYTQVPVKSLSSMWISRSRKIKHQHPNCNKHGNPPSRWHHGPFSPAITLPFMRLALPSPAFLSGSTIPGWNPLNTCSLDPHCLPHWSIRFTRFTARPTLSLIVSDSRVSAMDWTRVKRY